MTLVTIGDQPPQPAKPMERLRCLTKLKMHGRYCGLRCNIATVTTCIKCRQAFCHLHGSAYYCNECK